MTVLHSGATKKYSDNWELAFGTKRAGRKPKKSKPSGSTGARSVKKPAQKKRSTRSSTAGKKRAAKAKR